MDPLTCIEDLAHPDGSGSYIKGCIQEGLMQHCSLRMWAFILYAQDILFLWALWHGKCPRSFSIIVNLMLRRRACMPK